MSEERETENGAAGLLPQPPVIPVARPVRPRIWTVFVAFGCAAAGMIVGQIVVATLLMMLHPTSGDTIPPEDAERMFTDPAAFVLIALPVQVALALAAFVPAVLSPEAARSRLALGAPALPKWGLPVLMVGALFPACVGVGLAAALSTVIEPDNSVEQMYESMTVQMAAPFVLFVAIVPGFVEEIFFRGYMQRRLLQRWPPALAIAVSTFVFALTHLEPHAMAFVVPIGVWLGVLAWRTASVWPGIGCHVLINAVWNVLITADVLTDLPAGPQIAGVVVVGAAGLGCFVLSVWLLVSRRA